jgi:hypothetical protein
LSSFIVNDGGGGGLAKKVILVQDVTDLLGLDKGSVHIHSRAQRIFTFLKENMYKSWADCEIKQQGQRKKRKGFIFSLSEENGTCTTN